MLIFVFVVGSLFAIFLVQIFERFYIFFYKKPLYLYFYPIPGKLNRSQKAILEKEFPFYQNLSPKRKTYFEHRVKSFLEQYPFIAREHLEITDQMYVLIASTYVMLTFGMRDYLIPTFDKIILYPQIYYSESKDEYHKGEFNPRLKVIVFSWEDFLSGFLARTNNINLGLHEFTHVLHFYSLKSREVSAGIFHDEFVEIANYFTNPELNAKLHETDYIRDYAYTNQFEFLAVLLEHFFETPTDFKAQFPELFEHVRAMINFKP